MNAEALNEVFETLGGRFDSLAEVPAAEQSRLMGFFSDWQDFYYGNYDDWDPEQVDGWAQVAKTVDGLISGLESRTQVLTQAQVAERVAATPDVTAQYSATGDDAPIVLPPTVVTGRVPQVSAPAPVVLPIPEPVTVIEDDLPPVVLPVPAPKSQSKAGLVLGLLATGFGGAIAIAKNMR